MSIKKNDKRAWCVGWSCRCFILLSFFVWSVANKGVAQEKTIFQTRELAAMGEALEMYGIVATRPGVHDASAICMGKKVHIEAGFGGLISQIRLELFDPQWVRKFPHPVYDFVERYLLRLILIDKREEVARLLHDDKVELLLNGIPFEKSAVSLASFIFAIRPGMDCMLVSDTSGYKVGWNTGVGTLQMEFPKRYELIAGKDKVEMEDDFQKELFLFVPEKSSSEKVYRSVLDTVPESDCYRRKGGCYVTSDLNGDRYYRGLGNGEFALFFDGRYPEISLANLFLDGDRMESEVVMDVEHRRYGKRRDQLYVSVGQWVAFCKQERCVPYFGVEERGKKRIAGTVLMVNQDLGYNHVLYYECDRQKFMEGDFFLKTWLYTYVPTHNVLNLFEGHKSKSKRISY